MPILAPVAGRLMQRRTQLVHGAKPVMQPVQVALRRGGTITQDAGPVGREMSYVGSAARRLTCSHGDPPDCRPLGRAVACRALLTDQSYGRERPAANEA